MNIPEQYLPVMPYLILNDARKFLDFAKAVFNATEQMIVPASDDSRGIMHGEIRIGNAVIMFADANKQWSEKTSGMFLFVKSVDSVWEAATEHGAVGISPPTAQEYGYSAGFNDPFGNQWWITEPTE